MTYYFSVKTENGAGLKNICSSDGITFYIASHIAENSPEQPAYVSPNPFSDNTTLFFELSDEQFIRIILTDMLGKQKILACGNFAAGKHSVGIKKELALAKGNYIVKLEYRDNVKKIKIIKF